jgi:hypothetical protein
MYSIVALTNIKRILKKYRKEYKVDKGKINDGPMQTLMHGSGRIVIIAVTM